ncbi:hypothetical protein JCM8547_004520 [Rhodosporidiobolus lusitaniae]
MFGESPSESPRLPSPWLSRSANGTPSPLSLPTPDPSAPSTPKDPSNVGGGRARRQSSLESLELIAGLAEDFDSISLNKGKLSRSEQTEAEEIDLAELSRLDPEVDHQGHIEYKLRLPAPTSLHRLEKLRTQLAWRLREGGGSATYEVGLLDDGTIVGLTQGDMEESLQTLDRMLAGLGGGRVEIARVLRIGGSTSNGSLTGTPPSGGSTNNALDCTPPSPTSALFPSHDVAACYSDLKLFPATQHADTEPSTPFFPPEKTRGPIPFPSTRTPEEKAVWRRDKRDERRARREAATLSAGNSPNLSSSTSTSSSPSPSSSGTASPSLPPSSAPIPITRGKSSSSSSPSRPRIFHTALPRPIERRAKPPKPPRPPRSSRAPHGLPPVPVNPMAPVMPSEAPEGEVRYIVEAVVHKSGENGSARRRKSSAARSVGARQSSEEVGDEEVVTEDDEEEVERSPDEEEEGWNYLDFDLSSISSSVRSAATAEATQNGGGASPPAVKVGA